MDRAWWKVYRDEVLDKFKGKPISPLVIPRVFHVTLPDLRNSVAGAIMLATKMGARQVYLLGYDCQLTGGKTHHHGDHPKGLKNAGRVKEWNGDFHRLAQQLPRGTEVVNCTRSTALDAFPRESLEACLC